MEDHAHHHHSVTEDTSHSLTTYQPLTLVLVGISIATFITAWVRGNMETSELMRLFMGFFLPLRKTTGGSL